MLYMMEDGVADGAERMIQNIEAKKTVTDTVGGFYACPMPAQKIKKDENSERPDEWRSTRHSPQGLRRRRGETEKETKQDSS